MTSCGERSPPSVTDAEWPIDFGRAGWAPGDECPNCGHGAVHAIVRAGVLFHDEGGGEFDETLAVYEAFCRPVTGFRRFRCSTIPSAAG
jgi:hypothetical protein